MLPNNTFEPPYNIPMRPKRQLLDLDKDEIKKIASKK
jgi:hypothetical protein